MHRNFFTTSANTWWNLHASGAAPDRVLAALATRDVRGSTVFLNVVTQDDAGVAAATLLQILEHYVAAGVAPTRILPLFEKPGVMTQATIHLLAEQHGERMLTLWQDLQLKIVEHHERRQSKISMPAIR